MDNIKQQIVPDKCPTFYKEKMKVPKKKCFLSSIFRSIMLVIKGK